MRRTSPRSPPSPSGSSSSRCGGCAASSRELILPGLVDVVAALPVGADVIKRDPVVAPLAPEVAPGVADEERLLVEVVADEDDGVAVAGLERLLVLVDLHVDHRREP